MNNVLPEPKLEQKFTKSVGFLLRALSSQLYRKQQKKTQIGFDFGSGSLLSTNVQLTLQLLEEMKT